ncbi:MAG: InlB B-repeat-containing protein [Planctomycetes bacterium]|nr:InlB B-repeat-containing protein [Planctomycetota bacterium]
MSSSKRNIRSDSLQGEIRGSGRGARKARGSGFLATAVLISVFCVGQAQATTYYVNKTAGTDAAAGTSVSTAWATIGKANAALRAGDTVYIRAGTYTEAVAPANSGTASNPITYKNYPGEVVTVDGVYTCIMLTGRSYITVDGIRGHNPTYQWVRFDNTNYCIVKNGTFWAIQTANAAGIVSFSNASCYNQVLNNSLDGWTPTSQAGQQDLILVTGNSTHNLIQGNTFGYGSHGDIMVRAGCDYTVIRNNIFDNPWHTGLNVYDYSNSAKYVVIENNIFRDMGTEHATNPSTVDAPKALCWHPGLQWGGGIKGIVRENVFYNCGTGISLGGHEVTTDDKFYHNTFYNNVFHFSANTATSPAVTGNVFVSNLMFVHQPYSEAGAAYDNHDIYYTITLDPNCVNAWTNNSVAYYSGPTLTSRIKYGYSATYVWEGTLAYIESKFPNDWYGNYQYDPQFVDATNHKFTLQATSPCIDKGQHLTLTVGAGTNSTSLVVADAGYFFSGAGAPWFVPNTVADTIYIEGAGSVQVASINYSTNTITLASPMTWATNKKVYHRKYAGNAPDIGAYEYQGSSTTYTLTVSATNGTVTKTPNQTSYTSGQTVTLQAVPNTGYTFSGWSGDLTGTTNPATLVMNANKSVTANFTAVPVTYTLTISATNGIVTKTPNQTSYTSGQTVTLQAVPNTGYTFSGWSGDLTGTTNPATLVMNSNKSVTANFTAVPITYTLTISAVNGTVAKTPNQTSYTSGQTVTLQATPNIGYTFGGWSGDLTGTTNPATLVMNANKSVTANFAAVSTATTYILAISAVNGTVAKTPDQTSYTLGQTVTLQATPKAGYTFSGWSGDLTGTTNPATLVMNANKSVTAAFVVAQPGVYYVDRGAGNDNNDGKSAATAWKSLAKVNSYTGFVPGDQILLHRGHIWREQLIVPASGTAEKPLTVGAYDTGNRPLLKGSVWLPSWTSAGTNQWQVPLSAEPDQVFFDGVRGTRMTSQAALTGPQQWCWVSGLLYVYAPSDPGSLYVNPGIEASVRPAMRGDGLVQIQDRSYVTVQDLQVTQSYSAGICLASSGQGLTVQNCEADNSVDGGIVATSPGVALSNVTIEGCLIHHNNTGIKEGALGTATYQEGLTVEGVDGFVVRGCQVYSNYARGVGLQHGAANGSFENCQVNGNGSLNVYLDGVSSTQIRYNKIYDCAAGTGLGLGLETNTYDNDGVQVYYNLLWNNGNGVSFSAFSGVTTQTRNLNLYNNTFYSNGEAIRWRSTVAGHYSGTNKVENNLLWTQVTTNIGLRDETTGQQALAQTSVAYNGFQQGAATDTTGTNAQVMIDPYFVDPSAYDFHCSTVNSPTVDTGTNVGLTRDFDGDPVPQGSAPDIGAYEAGRSSATAYVLMVSATNGTVTKTPDQASYTPGQTVTLQAVPNAGYAFSGWSGDLAGTTNPATLTMDANKSVTANFTAIPVTYLLTISAVNGTVSKTPNQTSYTSGQTVTLQAVPNTGYTFSGWSGDLTGTTDPATLVMNANKSVTANFTAAAASYTLVTSATNGAVAKTPNQTRYASGQTVTLQAIPNAGYRFNNWLGDLTGTTNPATLVINGNKSVTARFKRFGGIGKGLNRLDNQAVSANTNIDTVPALHPTGAASAVDQQPPLLGDCSPAPDSIQAAPDALMVVRVCDEGQGVDPASVSIQVDGHLVYAGDVSSYRTAYGVCTRSGTEAQYTYAYQQQGGFRYSQKVVVTVHAQDRAGNVMPERTYSFATEMYSFGVDRNIATDQPGLVQGRPATVADGQGNLWIVWHAGVPGSRHIYATRLQPDGNPCNGTVQLSYGAGDHCHPSIAIDGTGILYVVWQENASGVWDIYVSTSTDGQTWSAPKPLAGTMNVPVRPVVNRVHPVVAARGQSSSLAAVAWQEGPAGNQDIWVASSTNRFETATLSRVTVDPADQTDPAIAVDGQDTIFVLWTDARNGSTNVYGAASNAGPWTNIPVVESESNPSHPVLAVGLSGRTLHLAWVEDKNGNPDVFYAVTEGLPMSPLPGANIVDDTSGADQQVPALRVAAGADGTDRVFICWEDARNVAYGGTVEVYFADVSPGSLRTNVPIDDDGRSGGPHEPVLGADRWGYPYVVWVGEGSPTENAVLGSPTSGTAPQLYYCGATHANPAPLTERPIVSSAGGLVGASPESIKSVDDVSVAIPALACPVDAVIRAARILNPRWSAEQSVSQVAFGPGGLGFTQPVTVTIPYAPVGGGEIRVCWFDAATGTFRQDGVVNVRSIRTASGLAALQFETTRLGSFYLVSGTTP